MYTRKLLHQYIVDAFVKIEANRINWIKTHQKELHVEQYKGLMDYVKNNTGVEAIGRVTIMPSTFQVLIIYFFKIYFKFYIKGSQRCMAQNYQDAMSIVRKFGKPDLFLTVTCNPHWREITASLLHGQKPQDRPDIVAFKQNLDAII